jgi:predicted nucleic acid-binding protein
LNEEYVIDSSVLVQSMIRDTQSRRVATMLTLLNDTSPIVLHVPEFSLVECANVLWKRVRFSQADAARAFAVPLKPITDFPEYSGE